MIRALAISLLSLPCYPQSATWSFSTTEFALPVLGPCDGLFLGCSLACDDTLGLHGSPMTFSGEVCYDNGVRVSFPVIPDDQHYLRFAFLGDVFIEGVVMGYSVDSLSGQRVRVDLDGEFLSDFELSDTLDHIVLPVFQCLSQGAFVVRPWNGGEVTIRYFGVWGSPCLSTGVPQLSRVSEKQGQSFDMLGRGVGDAFGPGFPLQVLADYRSGLFVPIRIAK